MPSPPRFAPMLASTAPLRGRGARVVEPKLDGARTMATVHAGQVELRSRHGHSVGDCYPELLVPPPSLAGRSAVVDGELVAYDDTGRMSFQLLQARMNRRRPSAALVAAVPVVLAVFDLVWLDGQDLTGRPLRERRARLEELGLEGRWQLVPRLELPPGPDLEAVCAAAGLEGAVVKLEAASYRPGRATTWQKVKCRQHGRFVVGGLLAERRAGSRVGSLAIGGHDRDGRLRYVGQVGYGLGQATADRLAGVLDGLTVPTRPFVDDVRGPLRWVEPLVGVEVRFAEVTVAGTLRQPVLTGLVPAACDGPMVLGDELEQAVRARGAHIRLASGQRL